MAQLTTNLSDPLLELIDEGHVPVDGVEVGPWFSVPQIEAYRRRLPDLPFTFHGGNLIEGVGLIPDALARVKRYVRAAGSPWASMHITMWWPGMVHLMLRRGWRMPLPHPERATRRFIRRARRLERALRRPVLLENVEPLPFAGYDFEVRPPRLREVIEKTGCGLLLDLGHARVSAAAFGMEAEDYLQRLPLARTVQIHTSGPRLREGRLVDAHEPLQEVDYALLEWTLARTEPRVVTLEYIREREALRGQLARLRAIVRRA